jgi:hypothetical protein
MQKDLESLRHTRVFKSLNNFEEIRSPRNLINNKNILI